jgi:pyruvate kinase
LFSAAWSNNSDKKIVEEGDLIILTKGMHVNQSGGTNLMKILRVGDDDL